jgi:HAD superfamily hydrolase (TIGR01509 family)
MIKLIVFDLDGVLVDSKEIHYSALNFALSGLGSNMIIDWQEHLDKYDGLPTRKKLDLLTETRGLDPNFHEEIFQVKQNETLRRFSTFSPDLRLKGILATLKRNNLKIICATNSIRKTALEQLKKLELIEFFDHLLCNEDVIHPKPHPEIFLRAMILGESRPKETLIVEDSVLGRRAAVDSGAYLYPVNSPSDVDLKRLAKRVAELDDFFLQSSKWEGGDLNVLIPMAGAGSRFREAGYSFPKPLIDVRGKAMIQQVVDNINIKARYIFIVSKEDSERFNLSMMLPLIVPDCEVSIVESEALTEGAACTALLASKFIDNDKPLLIANSDQYVEWNSGDFMYSMMADWVDGGIAVFESTHPKWSFAKLGPQGYIEEVAEKMPISNMATVGFYFWKQGSDFVRFAKQMIDRGIRTNGEFYICPVYNQAIAAGLKIKPYQVSRMWGLGTPEDLEVFLGDFR